MTAIEWLRKELETIPNYSVFYTRNYQWIDSIMNEAKEMEKQQIIDAVNNGWRKFDGKIYYNETFNSDKQSYQDKMRDKVTKAKNTNK